MSHEVGDARADEQGAHPNQWTAGGVLTNAWRQLGKSSTLRVGLDGQTRGLSIVAGVAGALVAEDRECTQRFVQMLRDEALCPVIHRHYDCTPMRMAFGRMQAELMPVARYALKLLGRWTTLKLEQYLEQRPAAGVLRYGTLELLAQGGACHAMRPSGEFVGYRPFCKPLILQAGNASCIYNGTESEIPALSVAGIQELSQSCPYTIVNEQPDAAAPNRRKQAKSAAATVPANVFFVRGECAAHQGHRCIESREATVLGDIHAIAFSCSSPHIQHKLQVELKTLIAKAVYVPGEPNAEHRRLNELVVKHCLLRRRSCIAGDPDAAFVGGLEDENTQAFLRFWNGDWSRPVITHTCNGCCDGEAAMRENLYASAIGVDLLQSSDVGMPCADDWGTFGIAAGKTGAGILCHSVLPSVFDTGLPNWRAMLPANDQPDAAEGHLLLTTTYDYNINYDDPLPTTYYLPPTTSWDVGRGGGLSRDLQVT